MDARFSPDEFQFFDPRSDIVKSENRLPHWAQTGVTFRLADAIPGELLVRWEEERNAWLKHHPEPWSAATTREYHERFSGEIERWLDAGHGSCSLRDGSCAESVGEALRFFDGQRCHQISWVVMPNHVHALFALIEPWTRASKFRLPDRTEAAMMSSDLTMSSMPGSSGPEFPMQVVQP